MTAPRVAPGLALLAFALAACEAPPARVDESVAPVGSGRVYHLLLHRGAPYVDLEASGARGTFLVDTGANTSGVDQDWLASSGAKRRDAAPSSVLGTTGPVPVGRAVLERLDLGTGFFVDPVFTVQRFSGFEPPPGRTQAGLLGMDLLGSYTLTFDWRRATLELALRNERAAPPLEATALVLAMPGNLPTLEVRVGGVSLPCRLDTGATWSDLRAILDVNRAARRALEARGVALREAGTIAVVGVGGGETLPLLEVAGSLEIGRVRVAPVFLALHERGTLAQEHPLALASATLLARVGWLRLDPLDGVAYVAESGR